jgi:hypothetical protein
MILEVAPLIATADQRHLIEYKLSIQRVKLILFFKLKTIKIINN